MSSSAGKVLILPKGEYNNATQYQMLDAVRYNGSLYIAKKTTIGHVPEDGEYWMLSAIGASDVHWGDITGSIASQSDLINALDAKQNVLTFDSTPTASSNNPVTSAGIKTALDTKQDTLTFDTTPTSGSTNPVTSSGIHTAVQATASNLATIESSTTASQAYSEGDYLVLSGQLYEVIADIASGETLTVGTNISATTVGEELTALNNGLLPVLVWENPSITSDFLPQTVSLDLSKYSLVSIWFSRHKTYPLTNSLSNKVVDPLCGRSVAVLDLMGGRIHGRSFMVTTSGVTFEGAYAYQTYGGSQTTDNAVMVPYRIYGIR